MTTRLSSVLTLVCAGLFCCSCATTRSARHIAGGGDRHPEMHASRGAVERFCDAKIGLSVHWGPSSIGGCEIGWSRNKEIPLARYDQLYREFNPTNFDADAWCRFIKAAGFRYVSPTAKHHDGFSLWFSKATPYDMEATPFRRDIMRELGDACRRHGIIFGAYYSLLDWYHPDWPENRRGGPGALYGHPADAPQLPRYVDFLRTQCTELIRDYGASFIQFDGEWDDCWTHELGSGLYADLRNLSPDVLLNSRVDKGRINGEFKRTKVWDRGTYAGDFEERERITGKGNSVLGFADHPWQAWVTIDKNQWAHSPRTDKRLLSAAEVIRDVVDTICDNGNYMINLGPRPDGSFDPREAAVMIEAGRWIRANGEAIYGTRGGPYPRQAWGGSTRKGRFVYLFITDPSRRELALPRADFRVTSARTIEGATVRFRARDGAATVVLPPPHRGPMPAVIVLGTEARGAVRGMRRP